MDKAQAIAEARKLISEGKIEETLELLIAFLGNNTASRGILNATLQVKATLEKLQSDENEGVISEENRRIGFNQITRQTIALVEALETGQTPGSSTPSRVRMKWWVWVLIVSGLAGAGVGIYQLLKPAAPVVVQDDPGCPFDQPADFRILVLPFQPYDAVPTGVHKGIQTRLSELCDRFNLNASVKILDIDVNNYNEYPSNNKEAATIGNKCNAQLIIWGNTESKEQREIVHTRFKFLNLNGFSLTKLKIEEGADLDTIGSISSVATEGMLTEQVEINIQILLGLVALNMNEEEKAIQLLAEVKSEDTTANLVQGLALADGYLATGQEDKAMASYDEVLKQHPNEDLARNNRAALLYKEGKYAEAAGDWTHVINRQPENVEARTSRAYSYLKSDRLDKVTQELDSIAGIQSPPKVNKGPEVNHVEKENSSVVEENLDKLKNLFFKKVKIEEDKKTRAERTLESDPNNVKALEEKTKASRNLGDYRTAAQTATQLLNKDPDNIQAIATLIESKDALQQPKDAQKILESAQKLGISKEQLLKIRPALKEVINKTRTREQ